MQTKDRIAVIWSFNLGVESHELASCGGRILSFYLAITINVSRLKAEGDAVHTVAFACGFRAIVENVAKVSIADGAGGFCANHEVAKVSFVGDVFWFAGIKKARPACTRVEFGFGGEEF